jgi:predicted ATPase
MLGSSVPNLSTNTNARENRTTVNNITVQALDSESAARAVAKVINESAARSIPALSGTSVRGN